MSKTFRLSDIEEKALNTVSLRINRELVNTGHKPLRDTEILHEILNQTLHKENIEVSRTGSLIIKIDR
ncbi:hypothetical protein AMD27_17390 (plasmid) [Acinetobacter sp. TGL-Y2]|uniref:hypothetical protein n=1 Tax=Acinetobacter sp. TGL-Y2 TaxID=1407071 RepID=UPI0007A66597|nr:hypothetical protein [Acinetobacter sp. TGL-Y2]AMW80690.1 hypothetical protein AMD27_17390 [Acinetobacter sp. TGL-Y2]